MEILLISTAFFVSMLCAGLMGFAIQRGATCTVAAVEEVVSKRRLNRLISMVEASLWVVGGLLLAQALHLLPKMPAAYAVSYLTVLGGVLLGLGAYVNGACVFGAIARLGSGEWAYVVTPLGFYVGGFFGAIWGVVFSYFASILTTVLFAIRYHMFDPRRELLALSVLVPGAALGELLKLSLELFKH